MDGKDWYGPVGMGKGKGALTTATVLPTKARHVKIVQTGTIEKINHRSLLLYRTLQ